ncbi:MAG: class I SAM-dependent methyltransferase [Sporomusaceae bacterium]|nr:class I SAM-dependent methyltransferase [Sporomusaceae bacterium]
MKLGERLAAVASMVPAGCRLADIGTDHAYLPLQLAANGHIERAVAIDVNPGPYKSACDAVRRERQTGRIDVRIGNGLQPLNPGEIDVAVMAGMGAMTMIAILEARPDITASLARLILQPMTAAPQLRRWLQANGWMIVDETIVRDEGRLYEIIAAVPGVMAAGDLLEVGPLLWQRRHPLLGELLRQRLETHYLIRNEMAKSAAARENPKYQEQEAIIAILEERLSCL